MISGGTALLLAADKVIAKGTKIAAHMLEAAEHDIVFENGKFVVSGTDKTVGLSEVAINAFNPRALPSGVEPGLFETGTFDGGERTIPTAAISSKSRSTRTPAHWKWCATMRSMTSAT